MLLTGLNIEERRKVEDDYHEYLRGLLENVCYEHGIQDPIWIHSFGANGNGTHTYRAGNDPPGPSIEITFRDVDLDPPKFQ